MLNFSQSQLKEIKAYCKLNDISDTDAFINACFEKGYNIEKYGLLSEDGKPIEKEVIVEKRIEVPVEKIVTIYDKSNDSELLLKIQQLENQKKEFSTKTQELEDVRQEFSTKTQEMENIFQNKIAKKNEELDELKHNLDKVLAKPPVDTTKEKALQETLQKLKTQIIEKDKKIKELENELMNFLNSNEKKGIFLRGSNLGDTLYK
jgi:predicted RNase H-like nuclease (RuvC/YqgF family)